MKIALGSTNPAKISAVKLAVMDRLEKVEVVGIEVESGVSEQPRSDDETRQGAMTRANRALAESQADIGIGLEGGVFELEGHLWNTVWCSVVSKEGVEVSVNGARFELPQKLATLIHQGREMGPAMDSLTDRENVKQQEGMIGVVTNGWVKRDEEYGNLVRTALGRLLTPEWL